MKAYKCNNFVFSSSATIYKANSMDKIKESDALEKAVRRISREKKKEEKLNSK